MNVEQSPGAARKASGERLRSFLLHRLEAVTGQRPSIVGIERATGVKRQQQHEWYAGAVEPQMGSLQQLAKGLGVTRSQIVAAMDGEQTEAAPPWAERLQREVRAIASQVGVDTEALEAMHRELHDGGEEPREQLRGGRRRTAGARPRGT